MVQFGTPQPQTQTTVANNSVKRGKVQKQLTPDQRKWSDNVLNALKLPSKGSQARILAGAISGAQVITSSNAHSAQQKQAAGKALKTVLDAGDPPWKDVKKAEAATAAKIKLDMLSLANPVMTPNVSGGVNKGFWIQRQDADNVTRASFLCKLASDKSDVDGIPAGGEVIREAVASRAAQHVSKLAGIDIGMPESHMLEIDASQIPPPDNQNGNALGSVQEARPSIGSLQDHPGRMANISRDQAAGLAIFDMMTLNVDRHHGNVLLDANDNPIPIDHGGSLPDPSTPQARQRVTNAMGGRHNVVLRLPNAHQPMSDAMAQSLSAMSSSDYGSSLKKDRDRLGSLHPGQKALMPDPAIAAAQRAARFVKLGARINPRMSAAAIQSALAAAGHLFDPAVGERDFEQQANAMLQTFATRQGAVKEVCCSSNEDYASLIKAVEALGWFCVPPGSAGDTPGITDPLVMLSIVQQQLRPTQGQNKRQPPPAARSNMANEAALLASLANVRRLAALAAVGFTAQGQQAGFNNAVAAVANQPAAAQPAAYSQVLDQIATAAKTNQAQRLQALKLTHVLPDDLAGLTFYEGALTRGNLPDVAMNVDDIEHGCQTGIYPARQNAQPNNPPPNNAPPPNNPPPLNQQQPNQQNPNN